MSMFASNKIAARVTSTIYHSGNATLPGSTTSGFWQIRATALRTYYIGHAADGVIDLGLTIHNTLKAATVGVPLTATLIAGIDLLDTPLATVKNGQTLWADTIPADARFTFTAERGTAQAGTTTQKVIEVPELRQPIHKLILTIAPTVAPDDGEFYLRVIRRY